jgi:hypothetical protein
MKDTFSEIGEAHKARVLKDHPTACLVVYTPDMTYRIKVDDGVYIGTPIKAYDVTESMDKAWASA